MTDTLAIEGGTPVRDIRSKPWPAWPPVSDDQWRRRIEPALREVYRSGIEGLPGPKAAEFSCQFAGYCGVKYARLLNHGTDAIAASLAAVLDLDGWAGGGEVLLPNYTFIATASAPLDRRCAIRFVDIDRQTFNMDPDALEAAIKPGRTRAIIPVHLAGHPADMERINAVAVRHGIPVIEDCAQAHGARCFNQSVGAIGTIGAFSFQSTKNLTCGEGGAVVTNNPDLDARVVAFQDVGRIPEGRRWEYHRLGWNYRPSEYLAALLMVRLEDLEAQAIKREENATYLSDQLKAIPGITPPYVAPCVDRHAYHLYCMLIEPDAFGGAPRDKVIEALEAEGVPAWAGYTCPLSDQPALKHLAERHPEAIQTTDCPNTEWVCQRSIWLAQSILLAERSDMDDIAAALAKIQRGLSR
jgi:dTDP-4-amino-4,6-dideoxygalactose transaminase